MSMIRNLVDGRKWLYRCLEQARAEEALGIEGATPRAEKLDAQIDECEAEIERYSEWDLAETLARFGG